MRDQTMFEQREAIIRLLKDDDPTTVKLVKEQLAETGKQGIAGLRNLLTADDERVSRHVREVLGEIAAREASAEFSALCRTFEEDGDLEHANLLLSRTLLPGIEIEGYERMLEEWGMELKRRLVTFHTAIARVGAMAAFIGSELGFRGNAEDYYNPDNSLLPRVIDERLGIPISLSLLYMSIGARAGMEIEGVNFPGHFIVRHEDVLFDPFDKGRVITAEDCVEILARQKLMIQPSHLQRASSQAMLRRILANLLYIFQNDGQEEPAGRVAGWMRDLERK